MRYEKITEVRSLINWAWFLCAVPTFIFRLYWLAIVVNILIVLDCAALVYMIYVYRKKNKSIGATLKEHWFNILWLMFVCFVYYYYVVFVLH